LFFVLGVFKNNNKNNTFLCGTCRHYPHNSHFSRRTQRCPGQVPTVSSWWCEKEGEKGRSWPSGHSVAG
jgi:hypothetical protein